MIEIIYIPLLIVSAGLDSLESESESELEAINDEVKDLPMSSDREAEPSSSPIILKSFAAMSKVKIQPSKQTSLFPSSEKLALDSSATGDSLV